VSTKIKNSTEERRNFRIDLVIIDAGVEIVVADHLNITAPTNDDKR
jgi:hypothetical protein